MWKWTGTYERHGHAHGLRFCWDRLSRPRWTLARHIATSPTKRDGLSRMAVDNLQHIQNLIKGGLLESAKKPEGMKLSPSRGDAMIAST